MMKMHWQPDGFLTFRRFRGILFLFDAGDNAGKAANEWSKQYE